MSNTVKPSVKFPFGASDPKFFKSFSFNFASQIDSVEENSSTLVPQTVDLPNEILCAVFRYLKDSSSSDFQLKRIPLGFVRELRWVPETTHVCRQWRYAALGEPSLWAEVLVMPSKHWMRTVSKRANKCPALHIVCDWGIVSTDELKERLLAHCIRLFNEGSETLSRVKEVSFSDTEGMWIEKLCSGLTSDSLAPMLTDVTFSATTSFPSFSFGTHVFAEIPLYHQLIWEGWEGFHKMEFFYFFNPSLLQRLTLHNHGIEWSFVESFRALKYLHIEYTEDLEYDEPINPADVRRALRCLSQLQELTIILRSEDGPFINEDAGFLEPNEADLYPEAVTLPNLRAIKIQHSSSKWLRYLIHSIRPLRTDPDEIQTSPQPRIWHVSSSDISAALPNNLKVLPALFQHTADSYITSAEISCAQRSLVVAQRETVAFKFWGRQESLQPLIEYQVTIKVEDEERLSSTIALEVFCCSGSGNYNNLETLNMLGFSTLPHPRILADTIGKLPQLLRIKLDIYEAAPTPLFQALVYGTTVTKQNAPFVSLKKVTLGGLVVFDASVEADMLESLRVRRLLGLPLSKLALPSMKNFTFNLRAFMDVVELVEVLP